MSNQTDPFFNTNRYSGDDPEQLADEIASALRSYGRGAPRRMLSVIEFFEGELQLIEEALRIYAQRKGMHERASIGGANEASRTEKRRSAPRGN